MQEILSWLEGHQALLWWLGGLSIVTFFGSLLSLPYLAVQIPADYFHRRHAFLEQWQETHPTLRMVLFLLKNGIGLLLILAGIAMLVLPGQGLITIVIGLIFLNFPGKFAFERWLVTRPGILRGINWLRERAGHAPLTVPD